MKRLMTRLSVVSVVILFGASLCRAAAGWPVFVENSDRTSRDIPLKFELQKVVWDNNHINVWGKVTNPSNRPYKYVEVSFTALDESGNFLGRNGWYCEPGNINPGEVGYIDDKFIASEGRLPAKIEYKVFGE